jgi:hypothetical protein
VDPVVWTAGWVGNALNRLWFFVILMRSIRLFLRTGEAVFRRPHPTSGRQTRNGRARGFGTNIDANGFAVCVYISSNEVKL